MNNLQKNRLIYISIILFLIMLALFMIIYALKQNINVFLTPSQMSEHVNERYKIRLGGLVKVNSIRRINDITVEFIVTDLKKEIAVQYKGVLPDLFREGKGVVATGYKKNNILLADEVLAKHDENYMPKNVYEKLKQNQVG